MELSLEEKIIEFVAEQTGVSKSKITLDTCLLDDLGIDGDDGIDFFDAFSSEFKVDLSELNLARHFGPEGPGFAGFLFLLLLPLYFLGYLVKWLIKKIFKVVAHPG